MRNAALAGDYIRRARVRLKAVELLYREKSWADVVREAQECVELTLKSLLRQHNIEVPRIHDVSQILEAEKALFSAEIQTHVPELGRISKQLRRDREIAFYGTEDLTPSEFYVESDAKEALAWAKFVVETVSPVIGRAQG